MEALIAATRAGVVITEIDSPDELDELRSVLHDIWGVEIVPPRNLLRGMAIGGACLQLARLDERPVGLRARLPRLGRRRALAFASGGGAARAARAAGVGYALKLAQRAQALRHGITEMRWTYDPMLFTNARFNLVRLGAVPVGVPAALLRRPARRVQHRRHHRSTGGVVGARPGRSAAAATVAAPEDLQVELPADYHALRSGRRGSC